jgi:hypothetical protein
MLGEFLQGVGAFTVLALAGGYYLKWRDYKNEVASINAALGHMRVRKETHPEEREAIEQRMRELVMSYPKPPRVL